MNVDTNNFLLTMNVVHTVRRDRSATHLPHAGSALAGLSPSKRVSAEVDKHGRDGLQKRKRGARPRFPSCAVRSKTARPSRMPGTWFVAVTGRGARATAAYGFQFIDGQTTYGVNFHCRIGRRHTHRVAHRVDHSLRSFRSFRTVQQSLTIPCCPMQTSLWTDGRAWRRAGCLRRIGIIAGAFSALACPSTTAADAVQLIGCQTTHARASRLRRSVRE